MATLQELIKSEIADFFAGFGSPGEPETPEDMQSQLLARITPLFSSMEQEPVFFIEVEGDDWIQAGRIPGSTFDFNNLPDGINKLYAAPQLPQPAVDESAIFDAAIDICRKSDSIDEHAWNHGVLAVMSAFCHCRAAMLEAEPVSINDDMAYAFHHALSDSSLGADEVEEIKAGLRAAFANITAPPAPVPDAYVRDERGRMMLNGRQEPRIGYGAGWNACRAAMLEAEPVQGWIPCSERMPEWSDDVLCATEFDGPGDWRKKVGYWHDSKWVIYGASWTPTHWMPLPAAPQQEADTDNTTQQFESLGLIVTSDERKMELPRCSKHPETDLQVHPFEQLMSYPPRPLMYCPLCKPSVAEWVALDKQLRAR